MKGKWVAYSQYVEGKAIFIAGRQLDINKPLHGGNVEYHGGYSDDARVIERFCDELNEKEDINERI